jgi:hypothetical protein
MICRFFGGLFGSTPFGIVGGAMVDIWLPLDRGIATTLFSGSTFILSDMATQTLRMRLDFVLGPGCWTYCWRVHCGQLPWVALDSMDHTHHGFLFRINRPYRIARDTCTNNFETKSQKAMICKSGFGTSVGLRERWG